MEFSTQELYAAGAYILSGLFAAEAQRSTTRHHINLVIYGISEFDKFISSTTLFLQIGRYAFLVFVAFKFGLLSAVALGVSSFVISFVDAILLPWVMGGEQPLVWKISGYAMWPAFIAAWYFAI